MLNNEEKNLKMLEKHSNKERSEIFYRNFEKKKTKNCSDCKETS